MPPWTLLLCFMPERTRLCIWSKSIFHLTNRNKNCANYIKRLHIGAARWHFVILSVGGGGGGGQAISGKTWLPRSKRVPRQVKTVQIPWRPPQDSYAATRVSGHPHQDPHTLVYMARQNGGFGARMSRQLSLFFLFFLCFYVDSDCTDKWEWWVEIPPPSFVS